MSNTKKLGQWVFKNQDERWRSAAVDEDGKAYRYATLKRDLTLHVKHLPHGIWDNNSKSNPGVQLIGDGFDTSNWMESAIDREITNVNSATTAQIDACQIKSLKSLVNAHNEDLAEAYEDIEALKRFNVELLESLHAADSEARVSMTSGDLLRIMKSAIISEEGRDIPF